MRIDSLVREGGLELGWRVGPDWTLVNASMHADGYPLVYLQLQQDNGLGETDVRIDLDKCMLIDPVPDGAALLAEHLGDVCDYLSVGRSEPPPSLPDTDRQAPHRSDVAPSRERVGLGQSSKQRKASS